MSVFIGLGSNLGNGKKTLVDVWRRLENNQNIDAVALSSPYLTEPVGMESDNWFTNAVGEIETNISPQELLQVLQSLESEFGRKRDANISGYQDRTLDLDLLYFNDVIMNTDMLVLPHPRIKDRHFVLAPLDEIAPDFVDITTKDTVSQMHADIIKRTAQKIIKETW